MTFFYPECKYPILSPKNGQSPTFSFIDGMITSQVIITLTQSEYKIKMVTFYFHLVERVLTNS